MTKNQIQEEREQLIQRKKEIELRLVELRNLFRLNGRMTGFRYRELCQEQELKHRELMSTEQLLSSLKVQMMALSDAAFKAHKEASAIRRESGEMAENTAISSESNQQDKLGNAIRSLVALREKYQQFAADGSRISSKRQMASEFVIDINPIIKEALKK